MQMLSGGGEKQKQQKMRRTVERFAPLALRHTPLEMRSDGAVYILCAGGIAAYPIRRRL